ncbi:MAG TPA: serine hydrolase domain-containing protein [Marmoricola sp.]|nr:serine hydrolase domain-containing protein [Marmoricola sp.]
MTSELDREAHWQAVLDDYQAARRLPSLVAAVLESGSAAWVGTAGSASGPDVQYRIGSITKTMTAVLVLQCRDDGLLDLDDPLGRFVPESGYAGVSLRALLSHTSGMQSEPTGPWWERSAGGSFEALLAANDGSGRVLPGGAEFHYSNLGFALLGEVAARLLGRPWRDLAAERLWSPLGMTRTSYLPQGAAAQGYSVDHLRGTLAREPATDTGAMAPAGQAWSTLSDLVRFAGFLRDGHPDVLARGSLDEMASVQAPARSYGLGLVTAPVGPPGTAWWGHLGSMPGFQSCLYVDRTSGAGLVALCNGTTGFVGPELAARITSPVTPVPRRAWLPTRDLPAWAEELLGWWFWGNSAYEARFENGLLELRDLGRGGVVAERFERRTDPDGSDRIIGVDGYHRAETLHVRREPDGSVREIECATFRYCRTPYTHDAPAPGDVTAPGRPSSC